MFFWRNTRLTFFPLCKELFRYKASYLSFDLLAGLNVALIAFPQAMVYALLAGLPLEYGLYGATIATFASAVFSGSRVLNLGPTNSTAVVMVSIFTAMGFAPNQFEQIMPIVLVMAGIFLLFGALLNVASVVQYVSKSVIFGYMTAVISIMIVNQIHNALGFDLHIMLDRSITFYDTLIATCRGLKEMSLSACLMSAFTVFIFYFWRLFSSRNSVVVLTIISVSLASWGMIHWFGYTDLQVLYPVYASEWKASFQGFSLDNVSIFASTALVLSFICLVDGTTILKSLTARMGEKSNINQMVFGMGWANIACGLCSGMPASGSLIRSSTNFLSGAKTSMASLFCGIFCLLGIIIFGPLFKYIPKAGLSTILILLGLDLFNKSAIRIVLRSNSSDACVFWITLISSFFFPLNISIFLGVFLSVALFLKKAAIPEFIEYKCEDGQEVQLEEEGKLRSEISIIHVGGNLFFASAELFRDQIRTICKRPQLKVIILKLRNAFYIDATCLLALKELLQYMHSHGRQLILSEVGYEAIKTLKKSGLDQLIGKENIFKDDKQQTNMPTVQALKQAQKLIGQEEIVVRIVTSTTPTTNVSRFKSSWRSFITPIKKRFRNVHHTSK